MTRPDVFGLARAITEDAQHDDYRDDCTCSLCEEAHRLRDTATFRLATALLALEPVWQAAQEVRRGCYSIKSALGRDDRSLFDEFNVAVDAAITTARAALGRETT